MKSQFTALLFVLAVAVAGAGQEPTVELGLVKWSTDWTIACGQSSETGRPLFVQFQEVPGCDTCQDFGRQVLSHPLLVEAIEDHFHPLLVFNNKKGRDAEILTAFGEPAWNNPVVRLLNADKKDLIPRKDRVWSTSGIAERMLAALQAANRPQPKFLEFVTAEKPNQDTATFAMHCFWEGEAKLGRLEGVSQTEAGWLDGKEVVEIVFDPAIVSYDKLVRTAANMKCASTIFTHSKQQHEIAGTLVGEEFAVPVGAKMELADDSDRKYYLSHSPLKYLPLTPLQATRINVALQQKADFETWLSPRQAELLVQIRRFLAESGKGLEGLAEFRRPGDATELAAYQNRLRKHLAQHLAVTTE